MAAAAATAAEVVSGERWRRLDPRAGSHEENASGRNARQNKKMEPPVELRSKPKRLRVFDHVNFPASTRRAKKPAIGLIFASSRPSPDDAE
jgi:hypothetical protein